MHFSRTSNREMSRVLERALARRGIVGPEDTTVLFYDMTGIEARIHDLRSLFPASCLHAVAVKANPAVNILKHLRSLGAGAEVASWPELCLAEKAGFPHRKIVFDSPVKTREELEQALVKGVHINADSFPELDRIAALRRRVPSRSTVGIRLNPQVGTGRILSTSVAGKYSKFGIPLNENRTRLVEYFRKYDWLKGVHVHIGSQGCPPRLMVKGIRAVLAFVKDANAELGGSAGHKRIRLVDIGGGLPVSYSSGEKETTMRQYRHALLAECGELFTNDFQLMTEFGRYVFANTGWAATRVEYVKTGKGIDTALVHAGADLFLRWCYNPEDWHHDVSVTDSRGRMKKGGRLKRYVIGGPLCFAGDILSDNVKLPELQPGDYLLIHDAGAYTFSTWSRLCSRQVPKILGYYAKGGRFTVLKRRETVTTVCDFWS
jgi:diaminopimelate decarboxylase